MVGPPVAFPYYKRGKPSVLDSYHTPQSAAGDRRIFLQIRTERKNVGGLAQKYPKLGGKVCKTSKIVWFFPKIILTEKPQKVHNYSPTIKITVKGTAASRVFFQLKAEAVRMGERMA